MLGRCVQASRTVPKPSAEAAWPEAPLCCTYLEAGDTTNARRAVQRAGRAAPSRGDEELCRDMMQAEYVDGHGAQLRQLLGELMQARDAEVPEDLAKNTYAWLRTVLPDVLEPSTSSSV